MAQMVSPQMMILPAAAANPSTKDSRWLTLEVCREFQRSKCSRTDTECKFAHPPPHVEVQNGRVVACFDSIKGKCQRKDPPCKYLHPPQHLREQLLQNGRNNLILKNMQLQAYQQHMAGVLPVNQVKALPVRTQPGLTPTTGGKPVAAMTTVLPGGQFSYLAAAHQQPPPPQAAATNVAPTQPPSASVLRHPVAGSLQQTPQTVSAAAAAAVHAAAVAASAQYEVNPYALPVAAAPNPASPYNPYITTSVPPSHSVAMTTNGDANSPIISQALPHTMIPATPKAVRADKFEVCREFQRGTCSRLQSECRYAHPANHIAVDACDNHVTVCMDFVKNKCTRDTCKYFHPPAHLQALPQSAAAAAAVAAAPGTLPMVLTKKRPRDPADDLFLSSVPGIVPAYKRIAMGDASVGKGGIPLYPANPLMSPYQQQAASLVPLQQHPSYIPMPYIQYYSQPGETSSLTAAAGALLNPLTPQVAAVVAPAAAAVPTPTGGSPSPLLSSSGLAPNPYGMIPTLVPPNNSDSNSNSIHSVSSTSIPTSSPSSPNILSQMDSAATANSCGASGNYINTNMYYSGNSLDLLYQTAAAPPPPSIPVSGSCNGFLVAGPTPQQHQHCLPPPPSAPAAAPPSLSAVATATAAASTAAAIPNNAYSVQYFGSHAQLLDTLPVCQDFRAGRCHSPSCKKVHILEDYVEVSNDRVTVCRDFVTRQTCKRSRCKYYHIPIDLPPS